MLKTKDITSPAIKEGKKEREQHDKKQLIEERIDKLTWVPISSGSLNMIECAPSSHDMMLNEDGKSVELKAPVARRTPLSQNPLTSPERYGRLVGEIEPNIPVFVHKSKHVLLPFFSKEAGWKAASPKEVALKCLEIFKKTGRLLLDANNTGNVISRDDEVICIDVDMAVRPSSPLSVEGFFACSKDASEYKDNEPWYNVIKRYHLLAPVINKQRTATPVEKVLLGLIDLINKFGEKNIPDNYLTISFLQKFYIARLSLEIDEAIERVESLIASRLRQGAAH